MRNPFITNGYAGAEYFCDRKKETADILSLLENGNNVALISPRRYGKTDLIRHCFAQEEIADNYNTFIVDIYSTKTVAEFVVRLGNVILDGLKPKGRKMWERFVSTLNSVRTGISFDINGQPTWMVGVGDITSPQTTLDEIFSYINQSEKPCLIAIDEFQQIAQYGDANIEALLRTYVQYCSNANFIFSGSRQHLMGTMFTSSARPFYQSVTIYTLKAIAKDVYTDFCFYQFTSNDKSIDAMTVEAVYDRFDGVTYYMQRVMNELFAMTEKKSTCSPKMIDQALQNIIDMSAAVYEDLLYQLPEKQCKVLLAIAKEGKVANITAGKFAKKHGLPSPNSVKSAVPALVDRGLVTADKGVYQLYDRFLQLWILQLK